MERYRTTLEEVGIVAKLADMKEEHYRHTLALSTLIELLVDKGLLTRAEVEHKAAELDSFMAHLPYPTA